MTAFVVGTLILLAITIAVLFALDWNADYVERVEDARRHRQARIRRATHQLNHHQISYEQWWAECDAADAEFDSIR